jgi:alpha-L-fucosidase 2
MRNKNHFYFLVTYCLLIFFVVGVKELKAHEHILWYDKPAEKWAEALPVGNGRFGAMIFGGTKTEHLQLNDDSMWPGDPGWGIPNGDVDDLKKIRSLLFEGENKKADSIFVNKFSNKRIVRSHQTLGDLYIDLGFKNITDYKRQLDIETAVFTTSYKENGYKITERVFVSHPHNVLVIEMKAEKKGIINAKIRLSRPDDNGVKTVNIKAKNDLLYMDGEITQQQAVFRSKPYPINFGVKFETVVKVDNFGGSVIQGDNFLLLKNVSRVIIYVVSNSSYYYDDYVNQNKKQLQYIEKEGYDKILNDHIKDYGNLYKRVVFDLSNDDKSKIPTNKRIENVINGDVDLGLEALLFQYGRYLLISSSRKGSNPANLQGIWNKDIKAAWNSDYHLNINLQMNYWLANVTALEELNYPYFDFVDKLLEKGKEVALKNFGCRGSFAPHATDLWTPAWMRAPTAYWGCFMGAAGWLMNNYWDYYSFTLDTTFLKSRVFPALKMVATFYSDWLITDKRDGKLISAPSTSPENSFINTKGDTVATCLGSAVDQQIIGEVFRNYLKSCEILNVNDSLYDEIKSQYNNLRPGFVIGSDGRILEWDREYKEYEPGHRHMSQLYGFYPGNEISKDKTPKLFEAVENTIDYRLKNGGAGIGWSRVWLISCDARLQKGDEAEKNISIFIKQSLFPNLFNAKRIFQIDGNFGYTAAVAEMLLQSFEKDLLRILPALPSDWNNGYVKGLKARGGLTVDIYWEDKKTEKVVIYSKYPVNLKMVVNDQTVPVVIEKNKRFVWNRL